VKTRKDGAVLRQLSTLFNVGAIRELTDGQLLERFSTSRGEAAELAFEALVERHGPMVLRVCRAQLVDPHETQDAFQATFLILVQKARALWVRDSLGPWLHQVALRTASCARSAATRRRRHERRVAEMGASFEKQPERLSADVEKVLHDEINRLPECYRVPIVLCDLEGYTCEEAARRMGRPVGTVKSWRFRGRERLRRRLTRLGLAPSVGLVATLSGDVARAGIPKPIAVETAQLASRVFSQWMTSGEVPVSVRTLVKGVLKTMLVGKLRTAAAAVLALGSLTVGLGAVAWVVAQDSNRAVDDAMTDTTPPPFVDPSRRTSLGLKESDEIWSLPLRQAIGIGLDNSKTVRLISFAGNGTPFKVAPRNAVVGAERFKSAIMAEVSSIEQQYWNLLQAHTQLWAADRAVDIAQEIHKKEQAALKVGRGTIANVAEEAQRLEQLNLDLATRTSDVITTERLLRDLLGLPAADGRRIMPVTAATKARLNPDWEECKTAMLANQPDIVRSRAIVTAAERDVSGDGLARLERTKAYREEVIDQATQSLRRSFSEIDANYKQFTMASRLRDAAARRLDAQHAYFEEGRITVDRFLDGVSKYATAVAQEAQYKTAYNQSIVGLEWAKGTLLEHDQITVIEGPKPSMSAVAGRDGETRPPFFEPWGPTQRRAQSMTTSPPPQAAGPSAIPPMSRLSGVEPQPKNPSIDAEVGARTYSFQVTVKIGTKPVEIRGSFAITPIRSADSRPQKADIMN
jgi:RNA polymerase sigma factor (sigma-70 family)